MSGLLTLNQKIREQRAWIAHHGGDRAGYRERYGDPDMDHCYGDGGTAIYEADKANLEGLLMERQQLEVCCPGVADEVGLCDLESVSFRPGDGELLNITLSRGSEKLTINLTPMQAARVATFMLQHPTMFRVKAVLEVGD